MTQRRGTRDVVWIGLLMGLFALLCVNVAVGITKGFARPPGGAFLVLLSAPGLAFGWGGVALLFVAIPYALLTWRHGKGPGSLLAILGSLVFAFGVGGLAGALTSPAAAGGGRLAGGLASVLRDGVGTGFAGAILALVAVPGLLLALAPLVLDTTGARAASKAEGGKGAKAWYPERRLAPDGTEMPPEFGHATDVGPIRYREPGQQPPIPTASASTVTLSPPAAGGAAAKKAKPISGIRYADDPLPDVGGPPTTAPREVPADDLPSGVRYARSEEPLPAADVPASGGDVEPLEPPNGLGKRGGPEDVGPLQERPATSAALAAPPIAAPAPPTASERTGSVPPATPSSPARPAPAADVVKPPDRASAHATPPKPAPAPIPDASKDVEARPPLPSPTPWAAPPVPPVPKLAAPAPVPVTAAPTTAADAAVQDAMRSGAAYRRKLDATGLVDRGSVASATPPPPRAPVEAAPTPRPPVPTKPRPQKPSRPKDLHDAIRGLFSSLPIEELPPVQPAIDPPEASAPEPRVDPPGQRTLFDDATTPRAPGQRHPGTTDALFGPSVEAALERGSASLVLLKRKLGVGYARAASLMEALVEEGILGEMTASGSRPTLISVAEWRQRAGR